MLTFDAETHTYRIHDRIVPSVTQVLREVLPMWSASDWHLQRGRAVHACAALIAQGRRFTHDPRIAGQVGAVRRFLRECRPAIIAVEQPVYAITYQYGGTPDLLAILEGGQTVIDYKSQLLPSVPIQCAAYALAYTGKIRLTGWVGVGVELRDDGTYRLSERHPLTRYAHEWLALLTAYRVRQRCHINGGPPA